jgi:hypothetical protein
MGEISLIWSFIHHATILYGHALGGGCHHRLGQELNV